MTNRFAAIPALLLSLLFLASCGSSRDTAKDETTSKPEPAASSDGFEKFSSVVSGDYSSDSGLVTVYTTDEKVYWEIPDTLLGRDMMLLVRIAGVPENYFGFTGSGSKVQQRMVRLQRVRDMREGCPQTGRAFG